MSDSLATALSRRTHILVPVAGSENWRPSREPSVDVRIPGKRVQTAKQERKGRDGGVRACEPQ